jgi:hypothetical protein
MVIGEQFAWAHLPKTGGMATQKMFQVFPHLIVSGDFVETNEKHTPFADRAEQVRGKLLAMNLRRLPVWVLSRAQHAARWGTYPEYNPIPMSSPEQLADSSFPDTRIELFTGRGRFNIDRWLRTDSLAHDFLDFISEFTDVTDEQRQQVLGLGQVNAHQYDHDIRNWFDPEMIERMYERNPLWAKLEHQVYGDLYNPRVP